MPHSSSRDLLKLITIAVVIAIMIVGRWAAEEAAALAQSPDRSADPAPDFFIEAEVNNLEPYLGQQVIYTVTRYQAIDFPHPPYYEDHPFTGFWSTALIQRPPYTTTIAGRTYRVRQTHLALFPTRPGPVTLDPARLVIPGDIPENDLVLESQAISLEVRPLPANPPPDFKGAVGQFELKSHLNEAEGQVNQPMTLVVEISGAGNIETLSEPVLPNLANWRFLKSEVITNVPLAKEVVKGSRRFIWSVVPGRDGQQQIPAIAFSYYDPQTNTYQTISSEPILVTILPDPVKGAASPALQPGPKQEVRLLGGDIRHIKPVPARLNTAEFTWETSLVFYGVCSLLPLWLVGGAWAWQKRRQQWLANTPEARRRRAGQQAKNLLARAQLSKADSFVVIRQTLTNYLADKLNRPVAGLTSDQLIDLLETARLNPKLIQRVQDLLTQLEVSRFAPVAAGQSSTQALISEARALIDDLEKHL
jgi:hypothetical protein